MYIISSSSVRDGELEVHPVMIEDTKEEAIEKAQDTIAEVFGYCSWEEYLNHMDPAISEKSGKYSIYDCSCGHMEMCLVEWV